MVVWLAASVRGEATSCADRLLVMTVEELAWLCEDISERRHSAPTYVAPV